jgi:hypothetical protein
VRLNCSKATSEPDVGRLKTKGLSDDRPQELTRIATDRTLPKQAMSPARKRYGRIMMLIQMRYIDDSDDGPAPPEA